MLVSKVELVGDNSNLLIALLAGFTEPIIQTEKFISHERKI